MGNRSLQIFAIAAVLFAAISCAAVEQARSQIFTRWTVSEFQPDIPQGGRANTLAVHPTSDDIIFVASDTGGLFRSADRGARWRHVDSLPSFRTNSIAFVPSNPDVLIVTTTDDFKVAGGGGIWRSTDGGANWRQAAVTLPSGITGRLSGYEISIAPDNGMIYVGIEFGILMSADAGETWSFQDVLGVSDDRSIRSIVALGGNKLIAGGPNGVRRSVDGGTTWTALTTSVGGIWDLHALGRSPLSQLHAFAGFGGDSLFRTEDGGDTWIPIASAPGGGGVCGGISFTKVTRRVVASGTTFRSSLHVYYGNRCNVSRLVAPINPVTRTASYGGTWQTLSVDHGDPRDLVFDGSGRPLLLATDGGLHKTPDGGNTWTYTGGGRDGFNALQITEVKGQLVEDAGLHDLYFGTQDNDLWSSSNGGASWIRGPGAEGFFIEMQRRVSTSSQSKVTFVTCTPCENQMSRPRFIGVRAWTNPAGVTSSNPMILRRSVHLQGVDDAGGFSRGLAITTDLGTSWRQFAIFPEDRRDLPKLARPGSATTSSMVYQSYRAPGPAPAALEINHLARIRKDPYAPGTATVYYPAMTNFGGLGINPTMFAWYQVFAVSPDDPYHVIAPDVVNQRAMETRDGGDNWTELPQLTALATDGGRLQFSSWMFPIITAISFSPQNPRLVLAGTNEGGIFVSTDSGSGWSRIPGSHRITYVTAFEWLTANDVIVSTYGRGLWRLENRLWIPRSGWEFWCHKPCMIRVPFQDRGDPPPFEHGILVYEGRVLDARAEAGRLREIVVTPGSPVVFIGGDRQLMSDVRITYSNRRSDFGGALIDFRPPQKTWIVKGLVLDRDNHLVGAAFGDQPMAMNETRPDVERESSTKSPAADRPYVHLTTKRWVGSPATAPGEVFEVSGRNFPRGAVLEIAIDGQALHEKVQVDREGAFRTRVRAPVDKGLHRLEVRADEPHKRILDGSMFLVKHVDNSVREQRRPR